jgi:hypothetical protein
MLTQVMKTRLARAIVVLGLMAASLVYGIISHRHHLPPYSSLRALYLWVNPEPEAPPAPVTPPPLVLEWRDIHERTDVAALIDIRTAEDAAALRARLIHFLWGRDQLPRTLPTSVDTDYRDARYASIEALQRIDRLTIAMDFGLESVAYHFLPRRPNNRVVLYHEGHAGDFFHRAACIQALLEHGYAVVGLCMPLMGLNNQPTVDVPRFGPLHLNRHEHMSLLTPDQGHPIRYFLDPVVAVINYLHTDLNADFACDDIAMVGLSGGGWTTTLAAAIDPRIGLSFPVAGSYPMYLRVLDWRDWGDYEQTVPELYRTANYLELYVLGAHGPGRRQRQILNAGDPCCFGGEGWRTYGDVVARLVENLGDGAFTVSVDASHDEHDISPTALSWILDDLAACGPAHETRE